MDGLALVVRLALLEEAAERDCEEDRGAIGGAPLPAPAAGAGLLVWARVWTWGRAVAWRKLAGEVDGEAVLVRTGDVFNMVCGASLRPSVAGASGGGGRMGGVEMFAVVEIETQSARAARNVGIIRGKRGQ